MIVMIVMRLMKLRKIGINGMPATDARDMEGIRLIVMSESYGCLRCWRLKEGGKEEGSR
jgi:hypothetical protein